jgi:glyoxylase-like metal-dependent hydrolase (beta-lactamase superfamily II)
MTRAALICLMAAASAFLLLREAIAQRSVNWDAVRVRSEHVAGTVHYVMGSGGNIALSVGEDGIVMVDSQFAPLTPKILAAIRALSSESIRFLVNTHAHDDHIGGNANFAAAGAAVLARDGARARMITGFNQNGNDIPPLPAAGLPVVTFDDPVTLHLNGEDVRVIPAPPAHTDNDTYVYFTRSDVLHLGDVFRTNGYPGIDLGNGGTLQGTLDALQLALEIAGPGTKVLSGHGVVSTREDVRAFRDMILEVRGRVSRLVADGKTLQQVEAAKPTADLDARWGPRLDRFLPAVYEALAARR